MSFFIRDAMAAAATPPAQDGTFSLIMIVAIFVLFYFMLIRPQNKRAKEHRELINKLKKGDEIITSGGMLAKVTEIGEQYIKVSVAEGIEISLQRHAVSTVLPKGTLKSL
ncbi:MULTISPECIES: preprotein translocase subunit YajC [Legionella]|uniref:Sec translocon accessory complex subunit YajC n=1 Tax=Legionella septentrionalis TaxID=2498109 RepID=A0A3S0X047_9GAMM|nr:MULTISPECIES: preprotein translocase subunit YajC [Legionella]MCP0912993.1 preprotein translocase subunit YajC [Legionella sp. 27cVA30]RUQ85338.1 preprotein translocase subunit YajC [Legionella septentrionalis]RUQ96862.1 preprotein translocase subunit YajC [Legionella septentrionalis]RUR10927.1 preprotein translocase subunit YajC [Legionella septentrionalis]RUR15367.1 preprotein translocase subunit YajC [Legionella septentrionalis]